MLTIGVLSGKGGVGKSTIAVNLALALQKRGRKVALMDMDFTGSNVPCLLGLNEEKLVGSGNMLSPIKYESGVEVMSLGFFMEGNKFAILGESRKEALIKEFKNQIAWSDDIDTVIIDEPPGSDIETTGCLDSFKGYRALIVTQPTVPSLADAERVTGLLNFKGVKILGIIENMSFDENEGAAKNLCEKYHLLFFGSIPHYPKIMYEGDKGSQKVLLNRTTIPGKVFEKMLREIEGGI